MVQQRPTVTIYLDKRRKKAGGKYPLKLRVYFHYETRFYPTDILITDEEFTASYQTAKPATKELKALKSKINALEAKANEVIRDLKIFSFDFFEKRFLRPSGATDDVLTYYKDYIERLKLEERISTASNYHLSKKSLIEFLKAKGRRHSTIPFITITPPVLQEYENWMLKEGKSISTVGIYLRPLRTLFNQAIEDGKLPRELYPFGKRKYQIPAGRNVKKALRKEELKKLWEYPIASGSEMEKARDFWFFSYVCNGANMKDIAMLKYKNRHDDYFYFVRSKTKNTTKGDARTILVPLTTVARAVIEKYAQPPQSKETYVFPILFGTENGEETISKVQAFTRFVNQHIKRLAELTGVTTAISTYWARHSFTTVAVQNGASLEFIQESLGHASLTTTMNYWKGFEDNVKKDIAQKLMEF